MTPLRHISHSASIFTIFLLLLLLAFGSALASAGEVPFSTRRTIDFFWGAWAVSAADVDGDGDLDVLGAAQHAWDITWWENTAGDGSAWIEHTIDGNFDGARSVAAEDVDGDGDLDVLGAALTHDDITWWENTAGDGSAWTEHTIEAFFDGAHRVSTADVDGDGDTDVLGAAFGDNDVTWWENTAGDASAFTEHTIDADFVDARQVIARDLDGDGDADVLGAAAVDPLTWWENTAGDGSAWTAHVVDADFGGSEWISAADVEGDGDLDVLGVSGVTGDITWWENTTGDGTALVEHTIDTDPGGPITIHGADLDGDGDVDILSGTLNGDEVAWWENTAGDGSAWTRYTIDPFYDATRALNVADVNGDGDLDILGASVFGTISWWENETLHRSAELSTKHVVDGNFNVAVSVDATDVDGDGDVDLLGAAWEDDDVTWWENTAGDGSAWSEHTIDADFDGARWVNKADLDGDGDTDVLGAAEIGDAITWWENTAGDGTTWTEHTVDGSFDNARSVYTADVDGDGDLDVLGAALVGDVTWWENTLGDGSTWIEHSVEANHAGARVAYPADVDGDGDVDVLGAARIDDDITWFENTAGDGSAWIEHTIDDFFDGAHRAVGADVDGDGDVDVLGMAAEVDDLTWWENTVGDGSAWVEHTIDGSFDYADSVHAADVDGDGDVDVLGTAGFADDVTWFENTAGDGSAWVKHTIDGNFDGAFSVSAADVDGDGDLDVLGAAEFDQTIAWWENRGGQFALPTADAVTSTTPNEADDDVLVLRIDAAHRGRTGDGDLELATFELLFEQAPGDALTDAELDAVVDAVRVYRDDGDGVFESDGSDTLFHTAGSPFSLASGVLTAAFVDGEAGVQVAFGTDNTYFVALDLTATAGTAVPDTVLVTHVTSASSTAEMTSTDIPLDLEVAADASSSSIAVNGSPSVAAPIGAQSATESVPLTLDLAPSFTDPELDMLTFSATGLPSSLALSPAGILSGTPLPADLAGSPYTVTVAVTDPGGLEAQDAFELTLLDDVIFIDGFETGDTSAWSCVTSGESESVCDDGVDNDCDGLIDGDDPDC